MNKSRWLAKALRGDPGGINFILYQCQHLLNLAATRLKPFEEPPEIEFMTMISASGCEL